MNLIQRVLNRLRPLPELEFAALDSWLRAKWGKTAPGGVLRFTVHDAAAHEVCAVLTAQGWLTEDAKEGRFHIQRPPLGSLNALQHDWGTERHHWSATASFEKGAASTSRALPSAQQRRCHVFGIGIAKSGTSSLAGLFSHYHHAHEYDAARVIRSIASDEGIDLGARDPESGFLECDSSQLHFWHLAKLVHTYPQARFILTLREPRAWLDSWINHRLARGLSPEWWPIEERRFGARCMDENGPESLLAHLGLPTLDGAFGFWARHHQQVLDIVPTERLLIVRLDQLDHEVERIARFAGVPAETLTPATARQNTARARFRVLERLDPAHLRSIQDQHCAAIWEKLTAQT